MNQNTWESWFGFANGWRDSVHDHREGQVGFSRDLTLKSFQGVMPEMATYLAFYLAGYDTLTRGYLPDTRVRSGERFDLHRLGGLASIKPTFPVDVDGKPLAWPDPSGDGSYIDAWNGIYLSRDEAVREMPYWTATEGQRVLAFGEGAITQDEADERRQS